MKKENLLKITDLRHELHMYPELSMQERETADRIKMFLTNNTHFRIVDRRFVSGDWSTDNVDRGDWFADRGAGRGNWFYAFKEGRKPGHKIAFRADMDALPIAEDDALSYHSRNAGVSHKCGHDGRAILPGIDPGRGHRADIRLSQPGRLPGGECRVSPRAYAAGVGRGSDLL